MPVRRTGQSHFVEQFEDHLKVPETMGSSSSKSERKKLTDTSGLPEEDVQKEARQENLDIARQNNVGADHCKFRAQWKQPLPDLVRLHDTVQPEPRPTSNTSSNRPYAEVAQEGLVLTWHCDGMATTPGEKVIDMKREADMHDMYLSQLLDSTRHSDRIVSVHHDLEQNEQEDVVPPPTIDADPKKSPRVPIADLAGEALASLGEAKSITSRVEEKAPGFTLNSEAAAVWHYKAFDPTTFALKPDIAFTGKDAAAVPAAFAMPAKDRPDNNIPEDFSGASVAESAPKLPVRPKRTKRHKKKVAPTETARTATFREALNEAVQYAAASFDPSRHKTDHEIFTERLASSFYQEPSDCLPDFIEMSFFASGRLRSFPAKCESVYPKFWQPDASRKRISWGDKRPWLKRMPPKSSSWADLAASGQSGIDLKFCLDEDPLDDEERQHHYTSECSLKKQIRDVEKDRRFLPLQGDWLEKRRTLDPSGCGNEVTEGLLGAMSSLKSIDSSVNRIFREKFPLFIETMDEAMRVKTELDATFDAIDHTDEKVE
ncbi:MAG: hypothetical protein M1828_007225 [Chrysothrix sp. TS-e1954]|nr:MAG: hypothetical protein M1828_007225 [Chrysothrix sp. TS-e1954]